MLDVSSIGSPVRYTLHRHSTSGGGVLTPPCMTASGLCSEGGGGPNGTGFVGWPSLFLHLIFILYGFDLSRFSCLRM